MPVLHSLKKPFLLTHCQNMLRSTVDFDQRSPGYINYIGCGKFAKIRSICSIRSIQQLTNQNSPCQECLAPQKVPDKRKSVKSEICAKLLKKIIFKKYEFFVSNLRNYKLQITKLKIYELQKSPI